MVFKEIEDKQQWNSWLLLQQPNTFLQSWEWGQVQKADGERVRYLGMFENDNQVGAALVVTVFARRGKFLLCPHGPIFETEEKARICLPKFVNYYKQLGERDGAVVLRIAPLLQATEKNREAFTSFGFRDAPLHIHSELTWVLDIKPSEDELLHGMRKTTRHAIKKAKRVGVTVDISTNPVDIDQFYPLYEATKGRHDFIPFSKMFLSNQVKVFAEDDRMYIAIARHEGRDVAAAIFMQFGDTVFYHHGASQKLASSIPANQLLQWESIKEAKRRGATTYNFWGIAPDDEPNHPFTGITVFKKGFGGNAINYMHLQDLSLSPLYWKLWVVEMLRKWKRGF